MPATGPRPRTAVLKCFVRGLKTPDGVGSAWEVVQCVVPIVLLSLVNFASSVLSDETKSNQEEAPMKKTLKVKLFLCSVLATIWTMGTNTLPISLGS
jgi:predicted membrane-bound mannosyltransferase